MENLKSYLDGELDIAQQAEVETHLRNDEELQKMVEEFSTISSTLKTADSGEPYGLEKLEEKLQEKPKTSIYERKKIWRLATYWSASMACLALAAMFVRSGSGSSADATAMVESGGATASSKGVQSGVSGGIEQDKSQPPKEEFAKSADGVDSMNPAPSAPPTENGKSMAGAGGDSYKGVRAGTPGDESASKPDSESKVMPAQEDALSNGSPNVRGRIAGAPNSAAPSTQWYDQVKAGKDSATTDLNNPTFKGGESGFKTDMRAIRDKTAQPVTTIGDTPHGIYLERAGQVQVKVDDLMRAVNEATGMVQSFHGFVTASDLQNQADGGSATMTIRVPTDSFNATLDKLQAMGEVLSVNSNSQDITSETVDQGARMVSWADEEDRLVKELAKAKNNDQRYRIRGELRTVRANLESYRASVKSLTERAKYSTINVSFVRGDKAVKGGGTGNWSGDALKGAKDNLGSIGQVLGTLGIYFLVFAPIWLPFAIAAYVIKKKNS
ncbi:MAG: DUF4349 domain-containing protein [Armatimonadota bacterium]